MYKAIVVDDEHIIRTGFEQVVDWNSMGFELLGSFDDGTSAMEFVDNTPVDLVITDIKMTEMSGLELAKHIRKNHPETRVIILSGYSDFKFAQESIKHGVCEYILKPLELKEFRKVLGRIKDELDADYKSKEYSKELTNEIRAQLLDEILAGAVSDNEGIDRRLVFAGIEPELKTLPCALIQIELKDTNAWSYGSQGLCNAVDNILHSLNNIYTYTLIRGGDVYIIASDKRDAASEFEIAVEGCAVMIQKAFADMLGIEIITRIVFSHKGILSLNIDEDAPTSKFEKQQRLIVSYVNAGDLNGTREVFEGLIGNFQKTEIKAAKNFLISTLSLIESAFSELGADLNGQARIYSFESLLKLNNTEDVKKWAEEAVSALLKEIKPYCDMSGKTLLQKAKNYIKENYMQDLQLGEVADHIFLNRIYFSKLFKRQTGENFSDYLVKIRIEEAMKLLGEQKNKIYEVSEMVGYKNVKYFVKLFKLHTGLTPTEYRQRLFK